MKLSISRIYQDDCTVGVLNFGEFRCLTLELPDLNNAPNISCIPPGRYQCEKVVSGKFGVCVAVTGVKGRTLIRIHVGNYTSQIQGCILVGDSIKDINRDSTLDVTNSKNTFKALMDKLPKSFTLDIK